MKTSPSTNGDRLKSVADRQPESKPPVDTTLQNLAAANDETGLKEYAAAVFESESDRTEDLALAKKDCEHNQAKLDLVRRKKAREIKSLEQTEPREEVVKFREEFFNFKLHWPEISLAFLIVFLSGLSFVACLGAEISTAIKLVKESGLGFNGTAPAFAFSLVNVLGPLFLLKWYGTLGFEAKRRFDRSLAVIGLPLVVLTVFLYCRTLGMMHSDATIFNPVNPELWPLMFFQMLTLPIVATIAMRFLWSGLLQFYRVESRPNPVYDAIDAGIQSLEQSEEALLDQLGLAEAVKTEINASKVVDEKHQQAQFRSEQMEIGSQISALRF